MSIPISRSLRRCEPHGLTYDPAVHDGCTLCRRSTHPPETQVAVRAGFKLAAMVLVMAAWVGGVLFVGYYGTRGFVAGVRGAASAREVLAPMPPAPPPAPFDVNARERVPTELPMLKRGGVDAWGYPRD